MDYTPRGASGGPKPHAPPFPPPSPPPQLACTFCMYGQSDLILFCFNAFDADNSGVIDENEFMQVRRPRAATTCGLCVQLTCVR